MRKNLTVLEALKNLAVLHFKRDRNPPGGKATLRVPGNDNEIEAWWHEPPEGQPLTLHFRPYPRGWELLTPEQRAEASKEALLAITMHNVDTAKQKARPPKKEDRKRRRGS
jgi:hypothetical protein